MSSLIAVSGLFWGAPSLTFAQAADPAPAKPAETVNVAPKAKAKTKAPDPAMAPIQDVAGLPRILLIGDSISIGYTLPVRKQLEGKANVHRITINGGPTANGVANLGKWLGPAKWDVIHFNFGLHDLKIMEGDKERVQVFNGTVIAKSRGQGPINATFTVRRVVAGEGVERIFPFNTPFIESIEVNKRGKVRRARLFYLRELTGKKSRIKERRNTPVAEKA